MTIAGLAREGGVGVETVRYYQRRGLLNELDRPTGAGAGGGIWRYGADDARRLRFIRSAQAAGFTLDKIGELLAFRIQRPRTRSVLTLLNDCDPADTCMTASVRPWVGRIPPVRCPLAARATVLPSPVILPAGPQRSPLYFWN